MEDTIAAISTPVGEGGIAIIRVSGARAFDIADRVFISRAGKPSSFPTHTIHFGTIGSNGEVIDQVMLALMRAPRTYTAEDTIEINCHGGVLTARKILSLCLQHGARSAQPGEFTKRAFLNGRIDLTQAEAVMDLIHAKTDRAHSAAARVLRGHLALRLNEVRDRLLTALAHIDAHIDFPEEDITPDTREELSREIKWGLDQLTALLATAKEGKILREGVAVSIVGRPNVGKSSLMNTLLGTDRSIVTPIPGTTRDTVEEVASIRGIPVLLTDTAGIRKPRGTVEALGVERSRTSLHHSDLVIHVLDASRPFTRADVQLADLCGDKLTITVLSKADLPRRLKLPRDFPPNNTLETSVVSRQGIEQLKDLIEKLVWDGNLGSTNSDVTVNERHSQAIGRAINCLTSVSDMMKGGDLLEVISQQLRMGLDAVGEVVGKTSTEDILDRIFSTFCIGK